MSNIKLTTNMKATIQLLKKFSGNINLNHTRYTHYQLLNELWTLLSLTKQKFKE